MVKNEKAKRLSQITLACLLFTSLQAGAVTLIPWVGTADYTAAPSADGFEDVVGPFDTYDFGMGAAVIDGAGGSLSVGDNLTGSYQSYVTSHEYNSTGGGTAAASNLNTTGSGSGYELTIAADFTETITSVSGSTVEFDITGGSVDLWFDTNPDFDFNNDTGFTSVDAILSGTIVGGSGTLISGGLFGVTSIDILITSFNAGIFDPNTIAAGNSVFTLQITNPTTAAFLNGITSVNGNTIDANDLLVAADGNLALQAIPIPAAVWLFGSGLLGLVGIARRKAA